MKNQSDRDWMFFLAVLILIILVGGCASQKPCVNSVTGLEITKCHIHAKPLYVCEAKKSAGTTISMNGEPCGFHKWTHCPEG